MIKFLGLMCIILIVTILVLCVLACLLFPRPKGNLNYFAEAEDEPDMSNASPWFDTTTNTMKYYDTETRTWKEAP